MAQKILLIDGNPVASNPGIVFSKDRIYNRVWREETNYDSEMVCHRISTIRKKLGLSPKDGTYIKTINSAGYRVEG